MYNLLLFVIKTRDMKGNAQTHTHMAKTKTAPGVCDLYVTSFSQIITQNQRPQSDQSVHLCGSKLSFNRSA